MPTTLRLAVFTRRPSRICSGGSVAGRRSAYEVRDRVVRREGSLGLGRTFGTDTRNQPVTAMEPRGYMPPYLSVRSQVRCRFPWSRLPVLIKPLGPLGCLVQLV